MASIGFEVVGRNQIITKVRGQYVEDEVIDNTMYEVYCTEKRNVSRPDIELVPSQYFDFLSRGESVADIPWDAARWDREVAPRLTPAINNSMFPFQKEAVYRMTQKKRCMNAAAMGLGKSLQALAAMLALRSNRLGDVIFCPGYLRNNWLNEVRKWCGEDFPVQVISKGDKKNREKSIRQLVLGTGLKIVSYDMAANFFQALKPAARTRSYFNTVICDESHFLKDVKSKRYRMLSETIKHSRNCFLLTGTPAPNRNKELYSQFSLIDPFIFKNIRTFTDRYCNGYVDGFGRYNDTGSSCTRELAFMTTKMVIRMRREDHLDELPAVARHEVVLSPLTYPREFNELMSEFRERLKWVDKVESAGHDLKALASAMFRETALVKEKPVLEFLECFTATNTEKTILFCVHQTMVKAVGDFLAARGETFITISGQTPMNARPDLIKRFLDEESSCKYALLTVGSCSTGLNMVPVSQMIFLELTWTPSELAQAECRINRIGGASHLSYTYLLCDGTLDKMVFRKLGNKNDNSVAVVDGGRDYGDFEFHTKRKFEGDAHADPKRTCK
jgi:SWI/SNF-related matrix-associated actin-dependent regulator 1 of chromatin subfamily A